jgi:hypothetical protein
MKTMIIFTALLLMGCSSFFIDTPIVETPPIETSGPLILEYLGYYSDFYRGDNVAVDYKITNNSDKVIIYMRISIEGINTDNKAIAGNLYCYGLEFLPGESMYESIIIGDFNDWYKSHDIVSYSVTFSDGSIITIGE